ncbi:MAG TPA: hypothetical protein VFD67_17030, partial [Gemmatimonadaceae bacterium]|nr:hypothetical protein [Gemmatimonadaceae bacterium]
KVTGDGLLDGVLFDTGDETIQLAGSVTFTEQGTLSPITGVSINPTSLNLQIGDEPILNATVSLREGSEASTAVNWSLVSTTPNGVIDFKPANNAVEVIANDTGTATLRATSAVDPTKFADITVAVTTSFFGQVQDAAGDALAPPEEAIPNPDVIFASLSAARGSLGIVIRFAPGTRVNNTIGRISFDTDRNITTGLSGIDAAHTDADKIGVDYVMLVGEGFNAGKAQLIQIQGSSSVTVGTFDAQYVGDEIHVTIPLSALGSNGNFNFKVESEVLLSTGVITQFLDIAPNAGLPVGIMLPPSPIG